MLKKEYLFIIIISFISCAKEIDLNQTKNLTLAPSIELPLIYYTLDRDRLKELQYYKVDYIEEHELETLPPIEIGGKYNLISTKSIISINNTSNFNIHILIDSYIDEEFIYSSTKFFTNKEDTGEFENKADYIQNPEYKDINRQIITISLTDYNSNAILAENLNISIKITMVYIYKFNNQ
ncbi:MAG: hypothetical protein HRT66_03100 [Flavobacteriaceae bacterium]|nr:hypothetical protein [Flavobacteriaceae bacterium]